MKRTISTFALAAMAFAAVSHAGTLAWFHFDEEDPDSAIASSAVGCITNACNSETPVRAYAVYGANPASSSAECAAYDEYMPRYDIAHRGILVYDPVSGTRYRNRSSMRFKTGTESGKKASYYGSTVCVPGSDAGIQPTDAFTVECFVCTTGGAFNTFSPLFGKNRNTLTSESWALYMTANGKTEVRLTLNGTSYNSGTAGHGKAINDGGWHHVAMTYDKADGYCRVYVDYTESFSTNFTKTTGKTVTYYNASGSSDYYKRALYIGGYPHYAEPGGGRKFNGCLDEVRISDTALSPAQFLRLQPEDDDELVRLRFDPHNLNETAVSTAANGNDRLDIPASFTLSGGTVALDSAEKYAATLRNGIFGDASANGGAFSAATNGAGKSGYATVANLAPAMLGGRTEVTNTGYTIEAFFKTRTTNKAQGARTLFTLANSSLTVAGAVLNNKNNGQLCFTCNDKGSWKGIYSEQTTANDGEWHHVAVVNDPVRGQMRFYFDGRLSAATNVNDVLKSNCPLYVGANPAGNNNFDGWIDDVRVMNRALSPDEFLTTHDTGNVDAANPTVALMDFEGNYSTAPYPSLTGTGQGGKHSSGGNEPEFASLDRFYLLDGTNGTDKVAGKQCLRFADSEAWWPYSPLFEQESFTVEFFSRFTDLVSGAGVVRYAGGTSSIAANPPWALYRDPTSDRLCLRIQLLCNGVSKDNYTAKWLSDEEVEDCRWHHYALTLQPKDGTNTAVELFRDYASAGVYELPGRIDYTIGNGGRLALGAGASANKIYGSYDMLRFSKRVLSPGEFIGKIDTGTVLIFR